MTAAVQLRGITKRFGDIVAVDAVDLDIEDGEFFAMLGPSGCGKTTTLRMIAGLEFPTEGSLRIFDDEVGTLPPNKRPVNTVFQSYALFPHLSVRENLELGLRIRGMKPVERRERIDAVLETVQLSQQAERRPQQLSGGQRQRVGIARALVAKPRIVLADEPTASLDKQSGREVVDLMRNLAKEQGVTVIMVTHDNRVLDVAEAAWIFHERGLIDEEQVSTYKFATCYSIGNPTLRAIVEYGRESWRAEFYDEFVVSCDN